MKTNIVDILLFITFLLIFFFLGVYTCRAYSENGFILSGNAQEGWILITPHEDYFGKWFGNELWAIWFNNETNIADCTVIRDSKDYDCILQEFSIILYYYPTDKINALK